MEKTQAFLNSKVGAFLLLAAVFGFIYNPYTKFPFTFMIIIGLILLFTFLQHRSLEPLQFKRLRMKDIGILLLLFAALEATMDFIVQPLVNIVFNEPADYSVFDPIKGNFPKYLKYVCYMWISAAVGEELLFRAFAFVQLRKIIGDRKILLVLLSAVLFSVPHLYQGNAGLAVTFLFGLAFGAIYARFRNIWINILLHGIIDTLFLTLAYFGSLSFYS